MAVSEAEKANAAIPPRTTKGCKIEAEESFCLHGALVNCLGWTPAQFDIAVVLVVKLFEDVGLGAQMLQRGKALPTKEALVMSIVKSLDDAITPGFSFGDENDFNPRVEAKAYDEPKAPRIPVRAPEGEFVVNLEKERDAQTLPLCKKSLTDGLCLLSWENFQSDGVAVSIDKMAIVEADPPPRR